MGKLKTVLVVGVAAALVGGVGVGLFAFRAYDRATKINREQPESVIGEYVNAYLVQRDDVRSALFVCEAPQLAAISTLRSDLVREEQGLKFKTQVVLGVSSVSDQGHQVTTSLHISQGTGVEVRTRVQYWRFTMTDEDGWRVCGAEQLPEPSPSPSATPSATPPTAG